MKCALILVAAIAVGLALPVSAQVGGGAPAGANPTPSGNGPFGKNMSQSEINNLSDYVDKSKRLTKKTSPEDKAKDKADAAALAAAIQLPCAVSDGAAVATSQSKGADGKLVDTTTYELSCSNGMGYLLVSRNPDKPVGLSCFAADAVRADHEAQGRNDALTCSLPENADLKAMAASVASHAGKACAAHGFAWVGQSSAKHLDISEVACEGGKGFILATAMPGATSEPAAMSCADAAASGIKCTLSDSRPAQAGQPRLTLQTFKDALAQHSVACNASNERVIGQENVRKRYVVEFACAQQPNGLVAFIPLEGNTNAFETLNCADAAKRGITCQFAKSN
jgi:hypothetical protein